MEKVGNMRLIFNLEKWFILIFNFIIRYIYISSFIYVRRTRKSQALSLEALALACGNYETLGWIIGFSELIYLWEYSTNICLILKISWENQMKSHMWKTLWELPNAMQCGGYVSFAYASTLHQCGCVSNTSPAHLEKENGNNTWKKGCHKKVHISHFLLKMFKYLPTLVLSVYDGSHLQMIRICLP